MQVRTTVQTTGDATAEAAALQGRIMVAMEQEAQRLRGAAVRHLTAHGATATGQLRRTVTCHAERTPGGCRIFMGMERYGVYVETGRRPGKRPPTGPIERWIRAKGLRPRTTAADGSATEAPNRPRGRAGEQWRRGLAYVIARRIGQRGIKARPWVRPAVQERMPAIEAALRRAVRGGAGGGAP